MSEGFGCAVCKKHIAFTDVYYTITHRRATGGTSTSWWCAACMSTAKTGRKTRALLDKLAKALDENVGTDGATLKKVLEKILGKRAT